LPSESGAPGKKPLFWSAPVNAETDTPMARDVDQSHVPPVLRDLRKCVACGFPISTGRLLCVECEEKKWRGQLRSRTSQPVSAVSALKTFGGAAGAAPAMSKVRAAAGMNPLAPRSNPGAKGSPVSSATKHEIAVIPGSPTSTESKIAASIGSVPGATNVGDAPEFVLSAAAGPSQSWLASNRYILIALLVVAAAAAAVFFLR
jgi:hypothetical protein